MILYHGSNAEVRLPRILTTNRSLDFGAVFYTTSSLNQAENDGPSFKHGVGETAEPQSLLMKWTRAPLSRSRFFDLKAQTRRGLISLSKIARACTRESFTTSSSDL